MWTFIGKVMSLLFNTPSRFVIAFFPRNKCLLISWLHSLSAVILEPKKIKIFAMKRWDQMPWSLFYVCWVLSQLFHSPLSPSWRSSLVICISGIVDISPSNFNSSLRFHQPRISHDVFCLYVKSAGWQYAALEYSFTNLKPVHCSMSGSNCCFLTWIKIAQETDEASL